MGLRGDGAGKAAAGRWGGRAGGGGVGGWGGAGRANWGGEFGFGGEVGAGAWVVWVEARIAPPG